MEVCKVAKNLLEDKTCLSCFFNVFGSSNSKQWLCRNHLDHESGNVAKEFTCEYWIKLSASVEEAAKYKLNKLETYLNKKWSKK